MKVKKYAKNLHYSENRLLASVFYFFITLRWVLAASLNHQCRDSLHISVHRRHLLASVALIRLYKQNMMKTVGSSAANDCLVELLGGG